MHDDKSATPGDGPRPKDAAADAPPQPPTRRISSAELFAGAREIEIEHNGRRYQLRITQTGKLILTA